MKTITFNHPITKKKLFELPVESICSQSITTTIFGEVGHQYLTKPLAILGHSLGIIESWELYDNGFRVRIPNDLIRYEGVINTFHILSSKYYSTDILAMVP